jgi:hypothetical protein
MPSKKYLEKVKKLKEYEPNYIYFRRYFEWPWEQSDRAIKEARLLYITGQENITWAMHDLPPPETPIWCYAVWVLGIVSFFVGGPFGMLIAAATVIAIMILWAICTLFVQILYFFIQIYLDYKKFQP